VVAAFGPDVLGPDGALDRARLRQLVFADDARRATLEGLLHPPIRARMQAAIATTTGAYCLVCIPLLAERGRAEYVDRVLVVDCPEPLQIERVQRRDHLTAGEVAAIMRTQATRAARLALADDVIVNDGDAQALDRRVDALDQRYRELARAKE
jgi:dephospho-CoA kinase